MENIQEAFGTLISSTKRKLATELTQTGTIKLPSFNSLDAISATIHLAIFHSLCRSAQVWYSLNYNECEDNWDISIRSAAPSEEMSTKDYSLYLALQDALIHVFNLQTESKFTKLLNGE